MKRIDIFDIISLLYYEIRIAAGTGNAARKSSVLPSKSQITFFTVKIS